jgi:hypothetical protein
MTREDVQRELAQLRSRKAELERQAMDMGAVIEGVFVRWETREVTGPYQRVRDEDGLYRGELQKVGP